MRISRQNINELVIRDLNSATQKNKTQTGGTNEY